MTIDKAVLRTLGNDELALSELTRLFVRRRLMHSFERLVASGKVACRFDGIDYHYSALSFPVPSGVQRNE